MAITINGVEVKVGQTWRQRDGDTEVIASLHTGQYPIRAQSGYTFTGEGHYYPDDTCDRDLVSLLTEPPVMPDAEGWYKASEKRPEVGTRIEVRVEGAVHRWPVPVSTADEVGRENEWRYAYVNEGSTVTSEERVAITESQIQMFDTPPLTGMDVPGYEKLAQALQAAYDQASRGKGKERHANNLPFHEQPMTTINRSLGSVDGFIYQAHKKSLEAKRLPIVRAQAEFLGAINYLAGAWIELERQRTAAEVDL